MTQLTGKSKKLRVGNKYYFVDTDFDYGNIKTPTIKQRTVYRIVNGEFSTREPSDRYEVQRYEAFENIEEAKKYALHEIFLYKRLILSRINEIKKEIKG